MWGRNKPVMPTLEQITKAAEAALVTIEKMEFRKEITIVHVEGQMPALTRFSLMFKCIPSYISTAEGRRGENPPVYAMKLHITGVADAKG